LFLNVVKDDMNHSVDYAVGQHVPDRSVAGVDVGVIEVPGIKTWMNRL